jgi:hypothetical protein
LGTACGGPALLPKLLHIIHNKVFLADWPAHFGECFYEFKHKKKPLCISSQRRMD